MDFLFGSKILVIAPHNDDELIGCWFLMQRLVGNAHIRIVVVTIHDDDQTLTAKRQEETRTALARIGISEIEYWGFSDGRVNGNTPQLRDHMSKEVANHDFVFAPAPNDLTPDHKAIAQVAVELVGAERLVWYRSTWWTFTARGADFVVKGKFSEKRAALSCFKTQSHIGLLRGLIMSVFEELLASGRFCAVERFKFACKNDLATAPLNSISIRHMPRLIFWR
ncbi:PIG-L family deacetylase [Seongchinamella sediminis]|uniref:PIG-L family deacetylase n=1 Tax=Seongchinamella sediminis TaxID=2283635 RepID=A0A3L7DZC7_9GAMM|nr:PIG-L family deacetylase [Seongchinamella sediminis]RLQ21182.1 PIG-L family deacetylase [Seongchinamella sediminis]